MLSRALAVNSSEIQFSASGWEEEEEKEGQKDKEGDKGAEGETVGQGKGEA